MERVRDNSRDLLIPRRSLVNGSEYWATTDAFRQYDYCSDVVTPNFRQRVRDGEIINNPFKIIRGGMRQIAGISFDDNLGNRHELTYVYPVITDITDVLTLLPTDGVVQELITRAFADAAAPDYDSLVSLGELPETLSYLKGKLLEIVKAIVKFHKKRSKKRKKRSLSQLELDALWMELRYAIRPLIYDILGLLEALDGGESLPRETTRKNRTRSIDKIVKTYSNTSTWGGIDFQTIVRVKGSGRFRTGVLHEPYIKTTAARFGFTADRIPAMLWELTRLSFVIDWFIQIGNYLDSLTATARTNILAAWGQEEYELRVTVTSTARDAATGAVKATAVTSAGTLYYKYRRPMSRADATIDREINLSIGQMVDFAVILKQLIK